MSISKTQQTQIRILLYLSLSLPHFMILVVCLLACMLYYFTSCYILYVSVVKKYNNNQHKNCYEEKCANEEKILRSLVGKCRSTEKLPFISEYFRCVYRAMHFRVICHCCSPSISVGTQLFILLVCVVFILFLLLS